MEAWGGMGRYGEIWADVGRCGQMWADVGRGGRTCSISAAARSTSAMSRTGSTCKAQSGSATGTVGEVRNFVSMANFFAEDVGTNFDSVDSTVNTSPAIQFDTDECTSIADFFDATQDRHHEINPYVEVQGIGYHTRAIKQTTLLDNIESATRLLQLPALAGKRIEIKYKMEKLVLLLINQ